jgi:2-dehydro-3-deoxygluconokinase
VGAADILAIGEPMVEFNQTREGGGRMYLRGFGGDTSNAAIAAARQGAKVGYISAVGDDVYGAMLRELWSQEGVDHSLVRTDPGGYTAVYFVNHDDEGHHFTFFRRGSAASLMKPADLPADGIAAAKVLHLSGISLAISQSARDTCFAAVEIARAAGVKVAFDTNLRLKLWPIELAREVMVMMIRLSDICMPSFDDVSAISGMSGPGEILDWCHALGARIVVLKLGERGCVVSEGRRRVALAPHPCRPVDATGAGDTFAGAFLARIVAGDDIETAARYANVAAALSTEGYGAVDPIPRADRVRAALAQPNTAAA